MDVYQGHSMKTDALGAVAEATEGWNLAGGPLDLLLAFCSTEQDAAHVGACLAEKFKGVPIAGCTTAGEHLDRDHYRGSLVLTGIRSKKLRCATEVIENLAEFDEAKARAVSDALIDRIGISREELSPEKHFALTFIDGLSCKEEVVSSTMADALEGIPLLGGSAGDDLKFQRTAVIRDGKAYPGGAVVALVESDASFEIIKHQHYTTTPKSIVITRADVPNRRVYEIDGYPAFEAYARALGKPMADVTSEVTFMNPLTFVCNNEIYVRSIQRVEDDGSIIFYCGIEEGMVLSVGGHEDMESALSRDIEKLEKRMKGADLFIACNCILRALEAKKGGFEASLGRVLRKFSKHVVGFDTYGEQLSGLHINQTLVGIALREEQVA